MTTALSCANRCVFCWRGYKAPISKTWDWKTDDPEFIIDESIKAQNELLVGFKGLESADKRLLEESKDVRHVALSLTGEPIIYPKINELLKEFHKRKISTFLVTNAQYPAEIKNLGRVTQLYLSISAPDEKLLKRIEAPLFRDYWKRLMKSLKILSEKEDRTCIRLTLIKDMNMVNPEKYAELIKIGRPDFIEIKAYMFVGASRQRLNLSNMPYHKEIKDFSQKLKKHLGNYEISSEHGPSRVVLLAHKKYLKNGKWYTKIDFEKFFNSL
jgi:tRNA wybutosine-synthesizing protein 1